MSKRAKRYTVPQFTPGAAPGYARHTQALRPSRRPGRTPTGAAVRATAAPRIAPPSPQATPAGRALALRLALDPHRWAHRHRRVGVVTAPAVHSPLVACHYQAELLQSELASHQAINREESPR